MKKPKTVDGIVEVLRQRNMKVDVNYRKPIFDLVESASDSCVFCGVSGKMLSFQGYWCGEEGRSGCSERKACVDMDACQKRTAKMDEEDSKLTRRVLDLVVLPE